MSFLLGYDIGSSSVKASLLNAQTGECVASATSPNTELPILSPAPGFAEQHPDTWWEHLKNATFEIRSKAGSTFADIKAIGISYQMHGLVCVDKNLQVLRPSIIWCDSRAVGIGQSAFESIGEKKCLSHLLNSPGNFTASKLKWVKENQPEIFNKIHAFMLPGDFVAMRLSGEASTTISGLSEGILWDFIDKKPADMLLSHYGISSGLIPKIVPTFSVQATVSKAAAQELGLKAGIAIAYRGGDQPNNALSLNVLNPGEIAATAGTSGVVYGVSDRPEYDPQSRVNTFVHVNHTESAPRYGTLLCINGTGICNSWYKHTFGIGGNELSYAQMNEIGARAPIGSDGLCMLPYGNGAERSLGNKNIGASLHNINFNMHKQSHVVRAFQEGIVFSLNYGIDIMRTLGIKVNTVRAGHANMFLSPLFASTFASTTGVVVELYNTDGAQGAARGAGIGAGIYSSPAEAFSGLRALQTIEPDTKNASNYKDAYQIWSNALQANL